MRRVPQASMERPSSSTSGWYWLMQENFLYSASFFSSWRFSRYFPLAGMAHDSCRGISGVRTKLRPASPRLGAAMQQVWREESGAVDRVPSLLSGSWCSSETPVDPPVRHLQPPLPPAPAASLSNSSCLSSLWCLYLVFAVGRKTRFILPAAV